MDNTRPNIPAQKPSKTSKKRKWIEVAPGVERMVSGNGLRMRMTNTSSSGDFSYTSADGSISCSMKSTTSRHGTRSTQTVGLRSTTRAKRPKLSRPSPPRAIQAKSRDKKHLPKHHDGAECSICYEPYSGVDEMGFLPCDHYFHKDCVEQWLAVDNSCPVCRKHARTVAIV